MGEYANAFKFGLKLLSLLVCLLVPIILFFLLAPIPVDIIEKTPLYSKPLVVTGLWQTKNPEKISTDGDETIYNLENDIVVKTNRPAKDDLELSALKGTVYARIEHPAIGPDVKKYMVRSDGYYADIPINPGFIRLPGKVISGILILIIAIFCIALYFPIARAIANLFKSR